MTEPMIDEQLKAISSLLQRVMQAPENDRVSLLREAERALAKLQESVGQRSSRAAATAPGTPVPSLAVRSTGLDSSLTLQVSGGAWWTDSELTGRLGITEDQRARIDRAFTNHRASLITKRDILTKEETDLRKLLAVESLDPAAAAAQIYRVTTARSELERENSTMALEMRQQLSLTQWNQLQSLSPKATITVDVPVSPALSNSGVRPAGTPGPRGQ